MLAIAGIEVLLNLDDMLRSGEGTSGALRYLFLRIPSYYWNTLVPLSAATAGFLCTGIAGRRLEMAATRAGGIPLARILAPILLASLAVSLVALGVDETWVVASHREGALHEKSPFALHGGQLWVNQGNRIYNLGEPDVTGRKFKKIEVFELDSQGRLERRTSAPNAEAQSESNWQLKDAVVQTFDPSDPTLPPAIQPRNSLNLELAPQLDEILLSARSSAIGLLELFNAIRNRPNQANSETVLRTALHQRMAQPVTIALMALIGIGFGLRVERSRNFGLPALGVVVTLGLFYSLQTGLSVLGTGGVVPGSSIWLLLLGLSTFGFGLVSCSPR